MTILIEKWLCKSTSVNGLCVQREGRFNSCSYKQALAAVQVALPQLHDLDVTTQRPGDYFAEMVKSDDHMKKVRGQLQDMLAMSVSQRL